MLAAIILAAGASSRMGSPKALLEYQSETFVGRLVRVLQEVAEPVIVALGYQADAIRPLVPPAAIIAVNPQPERGQLTSLQCALALVPESADGFLFLPVDCPTVKTNTLSRLERAFVERDDRIEIVVPSYGGQHGHPVLASRKVAAQLLALPETAAARDVIHRLVPFTQYVDVDDPGVLNDIDDRAAYERLCAAENMKSPAESQQR